MKSLKSLMTAFLVIALMLPLGACKRFSAKDLSAYSEKEDGQESKTDKSGGEENIQNNIENEAGYLVPMSRREGITVLYGYMDSSGNTVIEPRFKKAEPFYECGIAIVTDKDGKQGLIDKKGNYIASPDDCYIYYSDGLFLIINYNIGKTTAYNEKGEKQFEVSGSVYEFSDGLAVYYSADSRGYLDKSGKLAIPLNYEHLSTFVNGVAEVAETYSGPFFYIDRAGNDVTDKISSGLRVYRDTASNLFGYVNNDGQIVIEPRFSDAKPFNNGFAIVNSSTNYEMQYGIIDTSGNFVLEPKYCGIKRMNNGLIAVGEEVQPGNYVPDQYFYYGRKALFTPDMKNHTDWIYYEVENFDGKNVCVNDETSVYFVDSGLSQVKELPSLKGAGVFKKDGSLLRGELDNIFMVMDSKGNILFEETGNVDLGDGIVAVRNFRRSIRTDFLAYPQITGLKDKELEGRINELIKQETVDPYPLWDSPEPYLLQIFEAGYSISRQKNLLVIDQDIHTYSLGAAHGSNHRNAVHIDLEKARLYTLDDLFKTSDAYSYLSDTVSAQMAESKEEMLYWEDHAAVTPESNFVLVQDGIIIFFAEYEIAPYAAGMPEFFISFDGLMPYIDTEGGFWKSFN